MPQTPHQPRIQRQVHSCIRGLSVLTDASFGFMPAFYDPKTEEVHLATYEDGQPAVIHVLDGIPGDWVSEWGVDGRPVALKTGIIAGYMRSGAFFTLDDVLNRLCDS